MNQNGEKCSPKEKAKELVTKYFEELCHADCYVRDGDCAIEFKHTEVVARELALIVCEEVLSATMPIGARNGEERQMEVYWDNVKLEIEKL